MFVAWMRTLRSMFSGRFPVLTGTGEADLGRVAPVHAVLEAPLLDPQAGGSSDIDMGCAPCGRSGRTSRTVGSCAHCAVAPPLLPNCPSAKGAAASGFRRGRRRNGGGPGQRTDQGLHRMG